MKIDTFPFHIGPSDCPHNPAGLPDTWPFECGFDFASGALIQHATPGLSEVLDRAYRAGQLVGTPLAEDDFGKPYADDFLAFINDTVAKGGRTALEIGAGVGYITRQLIESGWHATGIEPGNGYAQHWLRYGVDIINDFFPNSAVRGPYDLICSYAVLEHIADPVQFLIDIRERLEPEGNLVLSVPDCTEEIVAGDPAILLHEHFTYFNPDTLSNMLWRAGFSSEVRRSSYGRCLYVVARHRQVVSDTPPRGDLKFLESYSRRAEEFIAQVRVRLTELLTVGSVGIYCPARALGVLDPAMPLRFFDDDKAQRGKYLPPFASPIEGREALLSQPVSSVVVMSRTFGERIRNSLKNSGYSGRVLTVNDLSSGHHG
jgi:SAM-dependent methyltransferase